MTLDEWTLTGKIFDHHLEIALVSGQDIHEHSGNENILVLPSPVQESWPKNRKWVVLGAVFQKLQIWIVFLWLDLHD